MRGVGGVLWYFSEVFGVWGGGRTFQGFVGGLYCVFGVFGNVFCEGFCGGGGAVWCFWWLTFFGGRVGGGVLWGGG